MFVLFLYQINKSNLLKNRIKGNNDILNLMLLYCKKGQASTREIQDRNGPNGVIPPVRPATSRCPYAESVLVYLQWWGPRVAPHLSIHITYIFSLPPSRLYCRLSLLSSIPPPSHRVCAQTLLLSSPQPESLSFRQIFPEKESETREAGNVLE